MSRKNNAPARRAAGQTGRDVEPPLSRRHRSAVAKQAGLLERQGPHFMALRELFDKVTEGVEEYANLIAERIVQLGGKAEGTAHTVAGRSSLDRYWLSTAEGNGHIDALSTTLTDFGRHTRYPARRRPN